MCAETTSHDHHVRLLAGTAPSGNPVYEVVPATRVASGVYEVLGSPGLALGCATGDRIRVRDGGQFQVIARGGNICLVAYPHKPIDDPALAELTTAFAPLDGMVEAPPDRRFVVVTVPAAAGFPAVEHAIGEWASRHDSDWCFSNVYDEDDQPLNWWLDHPR